jgi:cytoskeletal protein CcmA (bactofilin family)
VLVWRYYHSVSRTAVRAKPATIRGGADAATMATSQKPKERPMFRREKDNKVNDEGMRRMREAIRQRVDQDEDTAEGEPSEEPTYRSSPPSPAVNEPYTAKTPYEPLSREPNPREISGMPTREPDYSFLSTPRQERTSAPPEPPIARRQEEPAWQAEPTPPEPIATTVAADTVWRGTLRSTASITVEGTFEGEIYTDQELHVAPDAHVEATVRATSIVIAGQLNGHISCRERLEILASGRVTGQIDAGSFIVHEGAFLGGQVRMRRAGDTDDGADDDRPMLQRVR